MAEITVVLPIYNGSAYLRQTLTSLSQQTFEDFEVLCIDDCSTDDSAAIVQEFAAQDARFVFVNTGSNLGTAAKAANFAAAKATGSWFVYSSHDDLFSKDWLGKLHAHAIQTGADAVLPDVEFYHENRKSNRRIVGYKGDHGVLISGREAFVASLSWEIPGNALWPMSFLKKRGFFDFGAFSDEYTVRTFFLACKCVAFCDGVFFYRQDNAAAITKQPGPGRLDEAHNNLMVWRLIMENGFDADVHGPFAVRTLRSVIRAQALIFRTPGLTGESHRILEVWQALQTGPFRASLEAGLKKQNKHLMGWVYRRAHLSRNWFMSVARISSAIASIKSRR